MSIVTRKGTKNLRIDVTVNGVRVQGSSGTGDPTQAEALHAQIVADLHAGNVQLAKSRMNPKKNGSTEVSQATLKDAFDLCATTIWASLRSYKESYAPAIKAILDDTGNSLVTKVDNEYLSQAVNDA